MADLYSGDRNAYIDSFNSCPLLSIDDLGVERNLEYAREQVSPSAFHSFCIVDMQVERRFFRIMQKVVMSEHIRCL